MTDGATPIQSVDQDILLRFRQVLQTEASALTDLAATAAEQATAIVTACRCIRDRTGDGRPGRLVVTGVGKAGHIARKLAATFASTGTPAFFMHPAEARHGDLGMVGEADVVLALSNSGASEEIICLLPSFERIGCPVLALVGRLDSPLARHARCCIGIGDLTEACPLGLAPSTSTTALLATGDALALTVQAQRDFAQADYARFHPAGALGRKLMTCAEAMRTSERVATVAPTTTVVEAIQTITRTRSGCAILLDETSRVLGLFSDGDLRRALASQGDPGSVLTTPVADFATCPCTCIDGNDLVEAALHLFASRHFDDLPVVDGDGRLLGLIDPQDLAHRGFEV